MTMLSVFQDVCKVIGLTVPTSVYGSTDRRHLELGALANQLARRIAIAHDWQVLKGIATVTGDGATEDFALPSDYERMLVKSQVWSSSLETPLTPITDADRWLGLDVQSFDFVINAWIIYGGQIHIKPALANAVTGKFFYQSNLIVTDADTTTKTQFDADTDVFRLDEQLLTLALIWQWREMKGLPYAEDLANYEILQAQLITRDKGSRTIRVGKVRLPLDVKTAYPQAISDS